MYWQYFSFLFLLWSGDSDCSFLPLPFCASASRTLPVSLCLCYIYRFPSFFTANLCPILSSVLRLKLSPPLFPLCFPRSFISLFISISPAVFFPVVTCPAIFIRHVPGEIGNLSFQSSVAYACWRHSLTQYSICPVSHKDLQVPWRIARFQSPSHFLSLSLSLLPSGPISYKAPQRTVSVGVTLPHLASFSPGCLSASTVGWMLTC